MFKKLHLSTNTDLIKTLHGLIAFTILNRGLRLSLKEVNRGSSLAFQNIASHYNIIALTKMIIMMMNRNKNESNDKEKEEQEEEKGGGDDIIPCNVTPTACGIRVQRKKKKNS
jgi:hypothetical protein